jgi:hypothetical protein
MAKGLIEIAHQKLSSATKKNYFNKLKIEAFNNNDPFAFAFFKKQAKNVSRGVKKGLGV